MTVLTTPRQIDDFRARVILSAMKLYLDTGIRVNRAYTPSAMRTGASEYTGLVYPNSRKGLEHAYADLQFYIAFGNE